MVAVRYFENRDKDFEIDMWLREGGFAQNAVGLVDGNFLVDFAETLVFEALAA